MARTERQEKIYRHLACANAADDAIRELENLQPVNDTEERLVNDALSALHDLSSYSAEHLEELEEQEEQEENDDSE